MDLTMWMKTFRPAVEEELHHAWNTLVPQQYDGLREMMAYHLGWEGEGSGPEAQGKRIRPVLVLLAAAASGAEWRVALPAAAGVELLHNFSLIHDDIEDNSDFRRGRLTVWKKWGLAQAINTGDAMFAMAPLAVMRLQETVSERAAFSGARRLMQACMELTAGQYLDISYETQRSLPLDAYWPMVQGKTAALLAACAELGAIAAQADERRAAFSRFGNALGLAFQALDDVLGIWGDSALTGKSAESDLVTGKKTLPVLFGLQKGGQFARRWMSGEAIAVEEVPQLAAWLEDDGARANTLTEADRYTREALSALDEAALPNDAGAALYELSAQLLKRTY